MNDFISLKEIEKRKEEITQKYHKDIETIYVEQIEQIMRWFNYTFPKRHLRWFSGMGDSFWILDGDIFDCDTYFVSHIANISGCRYLSERKLTRKEQVLLPLVNFYKSIHDTTNFSGVCIDIGDFDSNNYK